MINYALLGSVVLLISAGQLLFKQAGVAIRGQSLTGALLALATLPSFYLSLAIYGVGTVLWIFVLSRMPLALAYPWMAGAMVIVPLLSWFVFSERLGPFFWPGCALIAVGLTLTQWGRSE